MIEKEKSNNKEEKTGWDKEKTDLKKDLKEVESEEKGGNKVSQDVKGDSSSSEEVEITKEVIIEQLEELRRRIIVPVVAFIIVFLGTIPFSKKIMDIFLGQFKDIISEFIFTKPFESFWVHVKISAYVSAIVSIPLLIWQMWLFVSPALYPRERKIAKFIILSSSLLFILGSSFCFFLVLPASLKFLINTFSSEKIKALISISEFLSFALKFSLLFGFAFQTPLIVLALVKTGILDINTVSRARPYIIVLAFVVSAIVTPTPDALTQTLLAVPLIILWELGVLISKII
jgi:sec-independent protein translocase protein TatC